MNIPLGEMVEGTITSSDSIWYDDYDIPYYYDTYHLPVESGKGYLVELWSYDGDPIFFECEASGYDFSSSSYSSEVIYPPPGAGEYCIYLNAYYLNGSSDYAFRVTEY